MKRIKIWMSILALIVAFILTFTSCGAAKDKGYVTDDGLGMEYNSYSGSVTEEMMDAEAPEYSSGETVNTMSSAEKTPSDAKPSFDQSRKMIVRSEMSIQTKEFDKLMDAVYAKISELGGYVESANVNGNAINSHSTRSANIVARIPADTDAAFTQFIDQNSVVIRRTVETEDVTLTYVDMESRLSALRAEKESLEKLLKQATQMEDIIAVTDKLTEVIQEIESYQSRLRVYDNLIDYCTVSLFIDEVEYTTPTENQPAWQVIGQNWKKNFADMWSDVVDMFVYFVSGIPYLIPLAVIGVPVFLLIRRSVRKHRKQKVQPQNDPPPQNTEQ